VPLEPCSQEFFGIHFYQALREGFCCWSGDHSLKIEPGQSTHLTVWPWEGTDLPGSLFPCLSKWGRSQCLRREDVTAV
jgi:hypothetical protein